MATDCGYQAEVPGGMDWGIRVLVETCYCRACEERSDVLRRPAPGMEWNDDPRARFQEKSGRYAECGSEDLEPWGRGLACPRCGGEMRERFTAIWD